MLAKPVSMCCLLIPLSGTSFGLPFLDTIQAQAGNNRLLLTWPGEAWSPLLFEPKIFLYS